MWNVFFQFRTVKSKRIYERRNKRSCCTNIIKNLYLCLLTKPSKVQLLHSCFFIGKNICRALLFQIARTFGAIQLDHSECRFTVVLLISQLCWFERPWKENVWHQRSTEFYYSPVNSKNVGPIVYEVTSCQKYDRSWRCTGIIKRHEDADTHSATCLKRRYDII